MARRPIVIGIVLTAVIGCERSNQPRSILRDATITLSNGNCAGVIVGDSRHVITAAHCAGLPGEAIGVVLHNARRFDGVYEIVDYEKDIALIRLDQATPVRALQLATELPAAGSQVLFTSRMMHPDEPQLAAIERLAPCPSLPFVPAALHTTLRGMPGDSGGPVVSLDGKVVGLVHGGARCSIAAPTADFVPVLQRALDQDNVTGGLTPT